MARSFAMWYMRLLLARRAQITMKVRDAKARRQACIDVSQTSSSPERSEEEMKEEGDPMAMAEIAVEEAGGRGGGAAHTDEGVADVRVQHAACEATLQPGPRPGWCRWTNITTSVSWRSTG